MNKKMNLVVIFFFLGIVLLIFYLYIGDLYYLPTESKTIITMSGVPEFQKVIYWACDIQGEKINNQYIYSNNRGLMLCLKGSYYTGSWIYIVFILSVFSFIVAFFNIFSEKMLYCKKYSIYNYMRLMLLTLFSFYALFYYLSDGDILFSSGTEVSFMKFNHPILIKRYIYECNHEDGRHDEFLKMIARQTGSGEGDCVSTQFIFDLLLLFNVYIIIRWFYIIKRLIKKNPH